LYYIGNQKYVGEVQKKMGRGELKSHELLEADSPEELAIMITTSVYEDMVRIKNSLTSVEDVRDYALRYITKRINDENS
jgi:hypothetical protein